MIAVRDSMSSVTTHDDGGWRLVNSPRHQIATRIAIIEEAGTVLNNIDFLERKLWP
jgi:hypothetical protein